MPSTEDVDESSDNRKREIDLPLPIYPWIKIMAEAAGSKWSEQATSMLADRIRHQPQTSPRQVLMGDQLAVATSTLEKDDSGTKPITFSFSHDMLERLDALALEDPECLLSEQVLSMLKDSISLLQNDAKIAHKIAAVVKSIEQEALRGLIQPLYRL